jgi:hypothetical protein
MEFANHLIDALFDRTRISGNSGSDAGTSQIFDWPGLHARFVAAHAVRRELAQLDSGSVLLDGGFCDWPTSRCDSAVLTRSVNLNNSTDGKALHGMGADTAGRVHAGGRGQ